MAEAKVARVYYVSGTVQGVGYRYFAQQASKRLGVTGYVKNLNDGRVEVYAVGLAAQLLALRTELERGPRGAYVTEVAEEEARMEEKYAHDFSVEHDSW
ncbi:MAG TPA: acylphosphatase [Candidatus Limnocylindrales bacterium]|nr:acylphosphatase [Candidatus Limnocylindrales bacterium]